MIFVDTVAWLYLFDRSQTSLERTKAVEFVSSINEALCTSDLVVAETYKWLIHHGRPVKAASFILKMFVRQELALILPIEQDDREEAVRLLVKYRDHQLSYEDAITVALVYRAGIKAVFSFDKHFFLFPGIQRVPE